MFVSECDRNIFTVHIEKSKRKKTELLVKPPGSLLGRTLKPLNNYSSLVEP